MPRHIGTCFRFYTQMRVEKKNKAFAYKIYSHFTQQCTAYSNSVTCDKTSDISDKKMTTLLVSDFLLLSSILPNSTCKSRNGNLSHF